MPDVLVTRTLPLDEALAPLARFDVRYGPEGRWMPRDELLARVGDVSALISFHADRIDEELLSAGRTLRVVATMAVGYDNIDVPAATRRGVWIANTPGVVTDPTADLALLLILATLRRAGEAYEHVRSGRWRAWSPDAFLGVDPKRLTLGILGMGRIGKAVARRVASLDMRTIYHDPVRLSPKEEERLGVSWVGFQQLLAECDVLTIHIPLSDETRGCIGRDALQAMKPGSYVVNTSRGPVLDEGALIEALDSGHIAGAGLDVYANEPDVPAALRENPRVFCLPHIGTSTLPTRLEMMSLCVENVIAVLEGRGPTTPVNRPDSE
jgi:glyoxylate reductase